MRHVIAISVVTIIICGGPAVSGRPACDAFGPRVDCGYVGIDQQGCEQRGCCWAPAEFKGAPHVDLAWCFFSNAGASEYAVNSVEVQGHGQLSATLALTKHTQKELGPDLQSLRLDVEEVSDTILHIKITDAKRKRWEVPAWLFQSDPDSLAPSNAAPCSGSNGSSDSSAVGCSSRQYTFEYEEAPFSFRVRRRDGGRAVFDTSGQRLVFKGQYLELSTQVDPRATLYGAGERASETLHLRRNGMPRPLWNRDLGPTFLEVNMYGSHPHIIALEQDGSAWGALLLTSNALDMVPTPDRLSWRVTGGVLDLWVFLGPTPLDVLDQLTSVVGRPAMQPRWSLGWHQCKYGYKSVWEVEAVVANYSKANIPLECIWTDIDHLSAWMDFTLDEKNYPLPEMRRFIAQLHERGQKWVPIVDPGIKVAPGYPAYDDGLKSGAFVSGVNGEPYLGQVWPGPVHFPDFLSPVGQDYFKRQLKAHHEMIEWDGIWVDMDEVSNFCSGDVCRQRPGAEAQPRSGHLRDDPPWVCHLDCEEARGLNASQKALLNPPYAISNGLAQNPLGFKAMSVLAYHHDGTLEYDAHNLYGLSECKTTAEAVGSILGRRPFVLSRASFTGVGAYAAHWTGDNAATWTDLAWSVPGVLNIGLFGIPMAGADICGFQGDTNEELCARWVELGAFYPFARDHSSLQSTYQELYRWPLVADTGRKVLAMRYSLLSYLYSAFRTAHRTGAPVMRPLWLNFPADVATHENSRQFMVGEALLVTPVLEQGRQSTEGYLPAGTWYSLWKKGVVIEASEGNTVTFDAPFGEPPLYMLGGTALTMQPPAMTTAQVASAPVTVVAALPEVLGGADTTQRIGSSFTAGAAPAMHAVGEMYHDDGDSSVAGSSLCHFLSFNITAARQPGGGYAGQALLLFGSHTLGHLEQSSGGSAGRNQSRVCQPVDDIALAAAAADLSFSWPSLAGVEVLGWQLVLAAGSLRAEVVTRADTCGGLTVLRTLSLPAHAARVDGGLLHVDLGTVSHQLECPYGVRLSWESISAEGDMAVQ